MAAVSRMFLGSIVVLALLGIASAKTTWLEGSIFCVRPGNEWSPLEGAIANVFCGRFRVNGAVTNETGHFRKEVPNTTFFCEVTLVDAGPNSDDCVVPKRGAAVVSTPKHKDKDVVIYSAEPLIYNPLPSVT